MSEFFTPSYTEKELILSLVVLALLIFGIIYIPYLWVNYNTNYKKKLLLHQTVYKTARILLMPYLKLNFRFRFDKLVPEGKPYIVLSNHATNWDPLLIGMSFPKHMYFVASEHIFRHGFLSKMLNIFIAPIMRVKSRTEIRTAVNILNTLKSGSNVCMFAEGSCTWNGETVAITAAAAKLVKRSGAALITYRLEGGYLTLPRWAKTIRRGIMRGYPVKEYSIDKLIKMTEEEIHQTICKDLYVNAYADNEKSPIMYNAKRLAENLEIALYVCPRCKEIATLKSKDDILECRCGLLLRYNAYGYFESINLETVPFKTVLQWDKWQSSYIESKKDYYLGLPKDMPIVTDDEQLLFQFEAGESTKFIGRGTLRLFNDRLVLEDNYSGESTIFPLCEITDMVLIQQTLLNFTINGKKYYEIKSRHPRSGLKYLMLCKCLTDLRIML